MEENTPPPPLIRFGDYELDTRTGELHNGNHSTHLHKQTLRLLLLLLERPYELVSREELRTALWPDGTFVDFEDALNHAIRRLRELLGDSAENPQFIETLPRLGYRFIGPASFPATPLQPETQTVERSTPQNWYRHWYVLLFALAAAAVAGVVLMLGNLGRRQPAIERRITANSPEAPVRWAVISPDGKYLAYASPNQLYFRQLDTGEVRPLPVPKEFNLPIPLSWFPDSTDLVIAERSPEPISRWTGNDQARSIWRLSILGGSPQKLMGDAYGAAVSPDGSLIAFLRGSDVWIMEANGANAHRIVNAAEGLDTAYIGTQLWPVVWSPTGRRIAYVQHYLRSVPVPGDFSRSIWTRDSTGSDPQLVMTGTGLGRALCWVADGRLIYSFHEDANDNAAADSLWAIKVDPHTGKPNGSPQRLSIGLGSISSLGVTADGKRAAFLRSNMESQVFIAEFDKNTRRLNAPYRLTLDENGNIPTAWTPESKSVLFASNRNGTWKIFRQAVDQPTAELVVDGQSVFLPRLSADGSEVLYIEGNRTKDPSIPIRIMQKNLAGGPPQEILRQTAINNIQCARIPSRLCLYSTLAAGTTTFFSFDQEHGKGIEIARMTEPGVGMNWSLSPDGSLLATVKLDEHEGRIRFMSLPTGVVREVVVKDWPRLWTVDWSADGAGLLMPSTTSDSTPVLLFVDLEGKARVLLEGERYAAIGAAIPSPDGRYLAFLKSVGNINVWIIENF